MPTVAEIETHREAMQLPTGLRVALVHDWLNGMRGGERVLEYFCRLFPDSDVHTLLYEPAKVSPTINAMNVVESDFAALPRAYAKYRSYLALMPRYVSAMPTAEYDLVISTSHCVAKAAHPPRKGLHLSYVFTPMRYIWDRAADYLESGGIAAAGLRLAGGTLRKWDKATCSRVDSFAADSNLVAERIRKHWNREAETIYPPVDLDTFRPTGKTPDDYFLVVSAFAPHKKIDRAIEAANLAKVCLVVAGGGPEEEYLKRIAGPTVQFAGRVADADLARLYQGARALLFPGVEDFGITPLESMACGRPVLALREGGVMETVVEGQTGSFFDDPEPKSLARLLRRHEDSTYNSAQIRARAEQFSPERFLTDVVRWIRRETRFAW